MIGRFPWDPFPPGTPDPKGPDPLHALLFRSAVTGGDAFRAVRTALRREGGVLRVGNRFVPDGRYREVAFVALGAAANSMALAVMATLGERVTRGFLAGPDPVPAEIPFRGVEVAPGWGPSPAAPTVRSAVAEISRELGEPDLLLLLLSPGAVRGVLRPPPGLTDGEFAAFLAGVHDAGGQGRDVALLGRVLGSASRDGPLVPREVVADVATLEVERGDGPTLLGGGPTLPVRPEERVQARAVVERLGMLGALPASAQELLAGGGGGPAELRPVVDRPVVVAGPPDALRAAADVSFEKGWTARLAALEIRERPTEAADRFLEQVEGIVRSERAGAAARSKGVAAMAMLTLDLPEGVDDGPALLEFLRRAGAGLRRREMSVGLFRTSGAPAGGPLPAGGVVGTPADGTRLPPGEVRPIAMRQGITDVGLLAAAVLPAGNDGATPPGR